MVAKARRNMHAPAYCPVVPGVKADDQRGVLVEVKNTMAMDSMPIIVVMSDEDVDMGIEPAVEVAMDIPDMSVADAGMDIDIEIELVDMLVI